MTLSDTRIDYWNRWAKEYPDPFESVHRSRDAAQIEIISSHVRENLRLSKTDIFLDLGCGSGKLTQTFVPYVRQVEAVDASEAMLDIARAHTSGVNYHLGECRRIPFPDNIFDKVLCYGVLQYCGEQAEEIFREIRRVLKPGGRVFIGDIPNKRHKFLFFYELAKRGLSLLMKPSIFLSKLRAVNEMKVKSDWFDPSYLVAIAKRFGWKAEILKQPANHRQYGWKSHTHRFDLVLFESGDSECRKPFPPS